MIPPSFVKRFIVNTIFTHLKLNFIKLVYLGQLYIIYRIVLLLLDFFCKIFLIFYNYNTLFKNKKLHFYKFVHLNIL
jgi:hypothetical protein